MGPLAVGQNIFAYTVSFPDTGIVPGTTIISQLSGTTGGAGTYKVSIANPTVANTSS